MKTVPKKKILPKKAPVKKPIKPLKKPIKPLKKPIVKPVVKKQQKHVEDHHDDCGENLDSLTLDDDMTTMMAGECTSDSDLSDEAHDWDAHDLERRYFPTYEGHPYCHHGFLHGSNQDYNRAYYGTDVELAHLVECIPHSG